MSKWQPSGVITMTTDFGHKGPFVAVMTGVIVSRFPAARVIDLAHDIPAHWPPEAGFWLARSYPYFPAGTVHVAIVDPGVGTERGILLAELNSHCFIAPDNGLLAPLLDDADQVIRLESDCLKGLGILNPSLTFHGRDIFAPVAAELAAGRANASDFGNDFADWTPGWDDDPVAGPDRVTGRIVTVDAFGNLISNIDANMLANIESPVVEIAGKTLPVLPTYGRAKPGAYLALVNSFGVIEVARAEDNAANGLGCERGAPITVRRS